MSNGLPKAPVVVKDCLNRINLTAGAIARWQGVAVQAMELALSFGATPQQLLAGMGEEEAMFVDGVMTLYCETGVGRVILVLGADEWAWKPTGTPSLN